MLLPRLRDIGAAPVVEAADGTVQVARPDVFRARVAARPRLAPAATWPVVPPARPRWSPAIRAGDRVAAARPAGVAASSPGDVLTLLRGATETGAEVLIGYVDNHGMRVERVVAPDARRGRPAGRRTTTASDEVRQFAVHRISVARLV